MHWRYFNRGVDWLHLLLINSFIALQLTLTTNTGFVVNLIYSQCIGLSVAGTLWLITRGCKLPEPRWWTYLIAVLLGVSTGLAVAGLITGTASQIDTTQNSGEALRGVLFSVLTGAAVTWYFFVQDSRLRGRIELAEQQARLARQQGQLSETNLRLLQTQIEPHFLFNTLSNISGLIECRASDAREMLESLTTYLRGSLLRTRQMSFLLSDEIELLEAYLSIQKIRMGKRLHYELTIDEQSRKLKLPPLLLQPLVENAITHGLEPRLEGGTLTIDISRDKEWLTCTVVDTGPGLSTTQSDAGLGLDNVRQRLATLYGDKASLKVINRDNPAGVCAQLTIPLAQPGANAL